MPNELEIEILTRYVGAENAAKASADLDAVRQATKDAGTETSNLGAETEKNTGKFISNRREVRALGNEISNAFGLGRLGGLAVGGVFAGIVAATEAIQFLKWTWNYLQETIAGPIDIGLPPDAPAHISAAAEAWNDYATARAKVITLQNSPQAGAGQREKELANELKLIQEVMAAEEKKALADLELNKKTMTPEAFAAAKDNIENIFSEAGTKAEEKNRHQLIENESDEAFSLEIDARKKTQEALGIKGAPKNVAETNQKFLDDEADKAETALKEINDRIAFVKKVGKPDEQLDYTGPLGLVKKRLDFGRFHFRYGDFASVEDALGIEEPRKMQAEAAVHRAQTYKTKEGDAQKQREDLMKTAGEESGNALGLRADAARDSQFERKQNETDATVARLHQAAADKITAASSKTAEHVEKVLTVTLGGFTDIQAVLTRYETALQTQAEKINRVRYSSDLH
jgi:hypothetical protein